MKYIVLIIFLFSPVRIQPQGTDLDEAKRKLKQKESEMKDLEEFIKDMKELKTLWLTNKQNYTEILEKEKARNDDLKRNYSELERDNATCDFELKQCQDRIQNKNAAQIQKEIDAVEKRIQEVLREKDDEILLSQKQKEEEKAALNQLNDEKSKLNKLKSEKERLLREIEKCQPLSKNSTVFVPESFTLSGSTCFLNNLIDYKSSLLYNLFSGLLGLARRKC